MFPFGFRDAGRSQELRQLAVSLVSRLLLEGSAAVDKLESDQPGRRVVGPHGSAEIVVSGQTLAAP